jgi:hypothetical protein
LPELNWRRLASASSISFNTAWAWRISTCPASVRTMRLWLRSNSLVPTLSSSFASCWESEGWARPSCLLARVSVEDCATAMKIRSWCRVIAELSAARRGTGGGQGGRADLGVADGTASAPAAVIAPYFISNSTS